MKLIQSSGIASKLLIVGDYPTLAEYNSGTAFSGPTGGKVRHLFYPFNAGDIYKTYYFKVPIPGWNSPSKKIREEAVKKAAEQENWDQILKGELLIGPANVVVAMGELALRFLTTESGIGKWGGSILHLHPRFELPFVKVVPTLHPRDIWEQKDKPSTYCQWDCAKAVSVMNLEGPFKPPENVWVVENSQQLYHWWMRSRTAKFLTLDIETHHGYITCIGFSVDGYEAISIPLLVGNRMDYSERGRLYRMVYDILASPIPKVNQNIKYDATVLEKFGFRVNNIVGDTMLMASAIYPEFPKGLDFLNRIYTTLPYYKDEGKKFDPRIHSTDRLLKYNARDALCTHQIWTLQQEDARGLGVYDFYHRNIQPAYFTYKKMDQNGIQVDFAKRRELFEKYQPMLARIQSNVNMLAERDVNLSSPAQVGRFLYEDLKCPKQTHITGESKEAYSTDEETIEDLYVNIVSDPGTRRILKDILAARKLGKVLQFLTSNISSDGRMRGSYKLQGTETGRTSAGKSIESHFVVKNGRIIDTECGGSPQTIPKHGYEMGSERIGHDLRSIFVPRPGYCFVEGDQGQAEDRVVCVLAEDYAGLSVLNRKDFKRNQHGLKDDRHTLTACLVTGKNFEDITPDDRQERGKKPRHAGNYNMGPGMLSILTHFHYSECRRILNVFHSGNPNIRGVFHEGIRAVINKQKYLVSPHGRRRDFFCQISEDLYKQAFSTIPQATVSDHNKFTILRKLVEKYPEPLAYPVAEAHDSLTFEVRLDVKDDFIEDFKKFCETPINFKNCSLSRDVDLVIPGDVGWSEENWKAVK